MNIRFWSAILLVALVVLCLLWALFTGEKIQYGTTDNVSNLSESSTASEAYFQMPPSGASRQLNPAKRPSAHHTPKSPQARLLQAPSEEEYRRLIARLQEQRIPMQRIDALRIVRISASNRVLERLLDDFQSLSSFAEIPMARPEKPDTADTTGRPFYNSFLPWLGIDPQKANRGADVVIAVLDEPVQDNSALAGISLKQLDVNNLAQTATTNQDNHANAVISILASQSEQSPGIAPSAAILSIPVLDAQGNGSDFTVTQGIIAAVDNHADIISLSLGGSNCNAMLQEAIAYAQSKGVVIVASAGNDGGMSIAYPAACAGVIGVGACDATGTIASFSNSGEGINIAAPGLGLTVTCSDTGDLEVFSGTSAAVPCVTGVIACLLSENPDLSPIQAAEIVCNHTLDKGIPGYDTSYGSGVLNYTWPANWNNSSYTDATTGSHTLDATEIVTGASTVTISAQNAGNSSLDTMVLTYKVNDKQESMTFSNVPSGETVSVQVPVCTTPGTTVTVASHIETPGAQEADYSNNTQGTIITPLE